jgi:3-oxo-5-alpha-steroid 4-dehydrogenase 1
MFSSQFHACATYTEIAFAAITAVLLCFIVAPYGRHGRGGFGPTLPTHWAWVFMELPTVAVFVPLYMSGKNSLEAAPLVLLLLWLSHYVYRTFIFPFRLKGSDKRTALLIVIMGAAFNSLNATIISLELSHFGHYENGWLIDPRFLIGATLFIAGAFINRDADRRLFALRGPGESGYKIPQGGLYRYVSCPNYLGEIIEWTGFALATWSLPGLAFALYTAANVGPRALSHHRWYQRNFADYPQDRKALIPFVL